MAISVVINTYNSSRLLAKTLDSVTDFDEIVVCDMESTDDTVEIAKKFGARVVTFPKGHHDHPGPARNFAIRQATHEWVLVVDSDEIVSPELRKYLYKFALKANKPDGLRGLYIPRKNYIIDRFRKSKYPDYQLRFFAKDSVDWPARIHAVPIIDGSVGKIPANKHELALTHIPRTIDEMIRRIDKISTLELEHNKGRSVNLFHLLGIPTLRFFDSYFVKGAFRSGIPGFIVSVNNSVWDFYRLAKIYEHNVRRRIGEGNPGDLPPVVVEEKLRLLEEERERQRLSATT